MMMLRPGHKPGRLLFGEFDAVASGGGSLGFSKIRRRTPGASAATGLIEMLARANVPRTE
jgi:hypothetical protein